MNCAIPLSNQSLLQSIKILLLYWAVLNFSIPRWTPLGGKKGQLSCYVFSRIVVYFFSTKGNVANHTILSYFI